MRSFLPACSLLILLGGSLQAHALGLGEARVRSDLSSPLLIEIPIVDLAGAGVAAEEVQVTVPGDAEQSALGAAEPILPHGVRVRVVAAEGGGALVRMTTDRASREPVLRFVLRASWNGGVAVRAFEVIVDPPFVAMPQRRLDAPRIQPIAASTPAASRAGRARLLPPPTGPRTPARAGSRYGPVRAGDTLYAIVAEAYPALAAAPGRAAAAIVARNPGAFIGGDPGRVLLGATLELPAADAIDTAPAASSVAPRSAAATAGPAGAASSGAPAPAATGAPDGERYTVRPGDTLYGIVRSVTGAGGAALVAAVERVFAANPQAFIDGDRDRLRVGASLAVDGLPVTPAAGGATATQATSPAVPSAAPVEAAPVEAGSAAMAEAVASARSELATLEQAVAAERALETDLSARLDRVLEEATALRERDARLSIETGAMRERLAALVSEAAAAPAGDAGGAAPAGTAAPDAAPAAREPVTAAPQAVAVAAAAPTLAAQAATASDGGTLAASAPPPAPEGPVDQVLGALAGAASASGVLIAAVAAALAGLLALLALRRRRSSAAPGVVHEEAATQASEDAARRRLAEVREQHEGANTGDFTDDGEIVRSAGERKVVMTDAAQANKLAKEAAVHMAYGNMEESKACILEAIRLDPGRDEHKMMLITIYESTNEHGKARAIVDDLLKRREELPQDLRAQVERKLESVKAG